MSSIIDKILKDPLTIIANLSVEELEKVIEFASDKYYNSDTPIINDQIYDLLIDFLKARDPKSKVLKNIGASVKSKNNLSDEEIKQFANSIEPKLKTKANTQRIKNALNKVVDAKMVNSMKQRFTKKNIWEN
jgi:NAD-dependent DNA ligase